MSDDRLFALESMLELLRNGAPSVIGAFLLLAFSLICSALLGLLQGGARWRIPAPLWLAPTSLLIALAGGSWLDALSRVRSDLAVDVSASRDIFSSSRYLLSVAGHTEAAGATSLILLCAALSAAAAGAALGLANLRGAGPDARATRPQLAATAAALLLLPATLYNLWPALHHVSFLITSIILVGALAMMSLGAARLGKDPADASRSAAARLVTAALAAAMLACANASTFGLTLWSLRSGAHTSASLTALDQSLPLGLSIGLAGALSTGVIMALATRGLPERPGRALSGVIAAALLLAASSLPVTAALQHLSQTSALRLDASLPLPALPTTPASHTSKPSSDLLIYDQHNAFKYAVLDGAAPAPGCPPVGADLSAPLCDGLRGVETLVAIAPDQPAHRLTSLLGAKAGLRASLLVGDLPRPLTALSGMERLALRGVKINIAGPDRWRAAMDGRGLVQDPAPYGSASPLAEHIIAGDLRYIDGVSSPMADDGSPSGLLLVIVATPDLTVADLINRCVALAPPEECYLIPSLPDGLGPKPTEQTAAADPLDGLTGEVALPDELGSGGLGLGEPVELAKLGQLGVGKKTIPSVQLEPTTVGDGMRDVIRRIMRRHMSSLRYCYEKGLHANPDLEGTARLKFTITAQGSVADASIDPASTLDDPEVGACLVKAVSRIAFPKPSGGGPITITYPLTFKSAQ